MERVAIIGAGAAGLASIKVCLEQGFEPVCFERTSHIGGVWCITDEPRTDPNGPAATYHGMHTLVTKELMAFSDFPFPKDLPPFLMPGDVHEYYESCVDHFGLKKYISLNTDVVAVEQSDDYSTTGRWRVAVRRATGEESVAVFDAVMVCTGVNSAGFVPIYPGQDSFSGEVIHSCQFLRGSDYKDKNVLVVGSSISAGDVAVICSEHARQVYLSVRHGAWIFSRWLGKLPLIAASTIRSRDWVPGRLALYLFKRGVEGSLDYTSLGLRCLKEAHQAPGMINDEIQHRIWKGGIRVRSGIKEFKGSKVTFTDGATVDDVDVVIFATGYKLKFPFFKKDLVEDGYEIRLYRLIFPPQLQHPTLAFIGYMVPNAGQNIITETQARYVTSVWKKETKLPGTQEMEDEISTRMDALFDASGRLYPSVKNSTRYMDTLARDIGAIPSFTWLLLTDPKLFYHFYFGPAYPVCYRLVGPGSLPDARERLLQCGVDLYHGVTVKTVRKDAAKLLEEREKRSTSWFYPTVLAVVCLLTSVMVPFVY